MSVFKKSDPRFQLSMFVQPQDRTAYEFEEEEVLEEEHR